MELYSFLNVSNLPSSFRKKQNKNFVQSRARPQQAVCVYAGSQKGEDVIVRVLLHWLCCVNSILQIVALSKVPVVFVDELCAVSCLRACSLWLAHRDRKTGPECAHRSPRSSKTGKMSCPHRALTYFCTNYTDNTVTRMYNHILTQQTGKPTVESRFVATMLH